MALLANFLKLIRVKIKKHFHLVFAIIEVSLGKASFNVFSFSLKKNKNFTNLFTKIYPHEKVNKAYVKVNFLKSVNFQ